jgi:hypothetical protein
MVGAAFRPRSALLFDPVFAAGKPLPRPVYHFSYNKYSADHLLAG